MNSSDVERINDTLDCELPEFYEEFLLNYPDSLLTVAKSGVNADGDAYTEGPADLELLNHADAIISLNQEVPAIHWENEWPDEQFVIGDNGCGDYYTIDIDDEESPVFFFEHEQSDFDETAGSLEEFAGDLILKYTDFEAWIASKST